MFKKISMLACITVSMQAVDIGSDTNVERFNNIVILDNGDRIAGFAAIDGGFKLRSAAVTGIFDSFFAASGEIGLRGGTLALFQDLIIRDVAEWQTLGNIFGSGHSIELDYHTHFIPARTGCDVELEANFTAAGFISLTTDWRFDSNFFAISAVAASTSNLIGIGIISNGVISFPSILSFPVPTSAITSVRWHPFLSLFAVTRTQSAGGDELFTASFTPPSSSAIIDSDGIGSGNYNACSWHPSGNFLAVGGSESGAQIKIYPVDSSGVLDLAGTLTVAITPARTVQREALDWDITGSFLVVGVNHVGTNPDLLVYQFSPEPFLDLILNTTALVETGANVLAADWNPIFSDQIAIGIESGFSESVQLYEHDDGGGGLLAGSLIKRGGISTLGSASVFDVHWRDNGTCLAVGRGLIGPRAAFRVYEFDEDIPQFDLVNTFAEGADLASTRWSPNGEFISTCINSAINLDIYQSMAIPNPITWSNLSVLLGFDATARESRITFTGECVINGRGNVLTFQPEACHFLVGSNASLRFKDITLKGISGDVFQGIDDTSTFSFDNVRCILDGDYTFSQGWFEVINNLTIEGGGHTFNYTTDIVSTIMSESSLALEEGATFNYAPASTAKTLLAFTDNTSSLILNSATLATTTTGIQLTKGNLIIGGRSFLTNAGSVAAEGIIFGDGINGDNNLTIKWLPAAQLEYTQGFVRDANV